nr:immunoglobulin heavy chain junction region [Macaca mulatta]
CTRDYGGSYYYPYFEFW